MTSAVTENRLDGVDGSYEDLLEADAIHWQPWDRQAIRAAREHDFPIFLSIGYGVSEWCHRMRLESFLDESVVTTLNASFVPIAVDRDHRPDIDEIYQTVSRTVEGTGGWPLSVWLTPECKPFYIGTYFPPEHTDYAPSFDELVELIAEKWDRPAVRSEIDERASEWAEYAVDDLGIPETVNDRELGAELEQVARVAARTADPDHGGWGTAAKAPEPARLQLLLAASVLLDDDRYRSIAMSTLDAIDEGTLHDHVGGGFFEYCAEPDWSDPVSEKFLGTNVEIARTFLAAAQLTGRSRYRVVAEATLEFLDRSLQSENTGYIAAIGAAGDTKTDDRNGSGEDNYCWSGVEIAEAIEDQDLVDLVTLRYGLDAGESDAEIPRIRMRVPELAERTGRSITEVQRALERAHDQLREGRKPRSRWLRDPRVFVALNGLACRTLAEASIVLDEERFADRACDVCRTFRESVWDGESLTGRYLSEGNRPRDSRVFLDDYAFLGRGALACFEASGDRQFLEFARDLGEAIVRDFWNDPALTLAPSTGEKELLVQPQVTRDRSTPASISASITLLALLDRFATDNRFGSVAERAATTYAPRVSTDLLAHHSLALALDGLRTGPTELLCAAESIPESWREWLATRYLPHRLLVPAPAGELNRLVADFDRDDESWSAIPQDSAGVFIRAGGDASGLLTNVAEADEWLDR